MKIDFTNPATIKRMAGLPYAGWAAAIIHRIDPLWGHDCRTWKVRVEVERGCTKCDGECCGVKGKTVEVEVQAEGEDAALSKAERKFKNSWAISAKLLAPKDPDVPEWAMKAIAESAGVA